MNRALQSLTFAILLSVTTPLAAAAQERLCDTEFEDCRAPILNLIRNEQVGIDVAFWFMEDARYATELIKRFNAGLPIRIIVDQRANATKRLNAQTLATLSASGIPMREKFAGANILHFKMMLFQGQDMLEFSKANYADAEYVPISPTNFNDEAVYFTNDDRLTNSFRRRFDDLWTDTIAYRDYANMTNPPVRQYPMYPIDPSMNFPPLEDFINRTVTRFNVETQRIDAIVYRAYDDRLTNAVVRAVARGVPVRLITEPTEYRNPTRLFDSEHIDRMFMGGAQIKMRQHEGLTHEAAIVLRGLGEVIFGSSNWTNASAIEQDEHNFFYNPTLNKPWFYQWFADQFDGKWNDTTNFVSFQPLPPDAPSYSAPINGASGQGSQVTLTWQGGPWAHFYDIYLGTTTNPPAIASNMQIGSPTDGVIEQFSVSNLQPGTTYYWRVVGRTWAQLTAAGPLWSFTTAGTPTDGGGSTPFGGTPAAVPGTIQAENFDDGGQFVSYFDTTAGNSLGQYRATDVDIESTADTDGGYNLGKTRAGEWLKYTVNVASTGNYQLETRVANMGTGARFHVEVDGVDKTGPIAVPDTGGWQTWQTLTTASIPLTAGTRVLRIVLDSVATGGGAGNLNWFRFTAIASSSPTTPFGGTPVSLPGTVQAENYDIGGQGLAYNDTSAGNAGNAYRSDDVDIGPTSDPSSGGFYVGWTRVGEWLKYTVNATATRNYALNVRVANVGSGAAFRIEVDGVDATGLVGVPSTGDWNIWQTITLANIALTQGEHVVRLVMVAHNAENSGVGNFGYFSFQ